MNRVGSNLQPSLLLSRDSNCSATAIMKVVALSRKCFQSLKDLTDTVGGAWGEDQLFRFNMWAANSSVFTPGHASMDWRLRDSPEIREMMVDSLDVLERHLTRKSCNLLRVSGTSYLNVFTVVRDPACLKTINAAYPPMSPLEEGTSFPSSCPSTSSSSSSSSSTIFASLVEGRDAASKEKFAVEETLDQLFQLTAFIRKSGIQDRYAKASKSEDIDQLTGVNLTEKFREGIEAIVNYRYHKASETLRRRLVETITLRQRQFSYSQRQKKDRESLTNSTKTDPSESMSPSAEDYGESESQLHRNAQSTGSTISRLQAHRPGNYHSVVSTQKSASLVDRSRLPRTFSAKASSVGSGIQNHSANLWLPSPPKNLHYKAKEFECPICFIIQPIEKASGEKWK